MWRAGKVIAIIHVEDWMEPLKTRREGRTDTQSHHSFSSCQELDSKFVEWRPWKALNTKLGRWVADASWCSARQGKAHVVKTLWTDFKHTLTCFVSGISTNLCLQRFKVTSSGRLRALTDLCFQPSAQIPSFQNSRPPGATLQNIPWLANFRPRG